MAVSQASIGDRALRMASAVGSDPITSPIIGNEFLTEDLFRTALREAVKEDMFQRSFSLTVAAGSVALPESILSDMIDTASINASNVAIPASFERRYFDYLRAAYDQIGYFTIQGNTLLYREEGGNAGEYAGTINVTAIALPDIPAVATTAIDMPATLADKCVEILARLIRGG